MFSNEVEREKTITTTRTTTTTKFEKVNAILFLTEIKACICFKI